MSNYTLNINNYSKEDVESALSLRSLEVKFENEQDAFHYEVGVGTIRAKVTRHIKLMRDKYEDQLEDLNVEYHTKGTSEERKSFITFVKRCVKYNKQFNLKKKSSQYKNYIKFKENFDYIINQLFQAYKLNKMVWVNKNHDFYHKINLNRYFEHIFDCDALCVSLDMLESLKYIDGIGYKKGSKYKIGQASRFIVGEKLCQLFDSIIGKVKFITQEYKEVVILKDEITRWKTIRNKLGEVEHIHTTTKKLMKYDDDDFTNGRRDFLHRINKFYDSKKIEVASRCILLKKSFIPILYNWIINDRIFIKVLRIEGNNNDDYITCSAQLCIPEIISH